MSDEEAAGSGSGSPSFGRPGRRKSLEEVIMDEEVEVAAAAVRAEEEAKAAALLPPVYTAEEAARKQELPIEPGALVRGPAYIGAGCLLRHGAYIRQDVVLGERCVVGGELKHVLALGDGELPIVLWKGARRSASLMSAADDVARLRSVLGRRRAEEARCALS